MENGAFSPDSDPMLATIDFNLMDELLFDGFWLETTTTTATATLTQYSDDFWQQQQRSSTPLHSTLLYCPQSNNTITNKPQESPNTQSQLDHPSISSSSSLAHRLQMDDDTFPFPFPAANQAQDSSNTNFMVLQDEEANTSRLWVAPDRNPTVSVKKKLVQAINHLKDSIGDKDVLIQIWVPVKKDGKQVLTTKNQPFSLNPKCKNLAEYRDVSRNFQFSIDEESKEFAGLPGRVFQNKLPEWTPDVRFFRREEYPRLNHAQLYDVRGSVALPVFQQGSGNCLGVVEVVTTNQQVNYRPELENLCKALEEVELKSYDFLSAPKMEDSNESYQAALAEIRNVLKCVCEAHELPLAQTWGLCSQQGKAGCRHSSENYISCVSTIDSACYVADLQVSGFHEACSEHHLLKGEGIAGQAFLTNQPCFAQDISAFTKTEYPLAHHARVFNLCAAVAIRLRSTYTETAHDFVLEFFLPLHCKDGEDQRQMLESLSYVIQRTCESLRVVTDQELARETSSSTPVADEKSPTTNTSSWVRDMMESQCKSGNGKGKGKGIVSLGSSHNEQEEDKDDEAAGGFRVTTQWDAPSFLEHGETQHEPAPKPVAQGHSGKFFLDTKINTDKRKSKSEKTISLEVLRQYFAGSLKDAAKNIGVCPTTLKRICRQHGISRWPSRKIQKVGHSLRKLQQVMDTVQGAQGSIQLTSFYNNFPELATSLNPNAPATGSSSSNSLQLNTAHHDHTLLRPTVALTATASKSPSSSRSGSGSGGSSSSSSSSSSYCVSTGLQPSSYPVTMTSKADTLSRERTGLQLLKRTQSHAELHESFHEDKNVVPRSCSQKSLINPVHHQSPNEGSPPAVAGNIGLPGVIGQPQPPPEPQRHENLSFRVKAAFGEEMIRFSLQPQWGFEELQQQVLKRFNITEGAKLDIKYLDDDSEWVLLTCDADLEECIDIHRSSKNRTVKLSLTQSTYHQRPSLGSSFGSNYRPSY